MKIELSREDLFNADQAMNHAVFIIAQEFWNKYGERYVSTYQNLYNKLKAKKDQDDSDRDQLKYAKSMLKSLKTIKISFEKGLGIVNSGEWKPDELNRLAEKIFDNRYILWN